MLAFIKHPRMKLLARLVIILLVVCISTVTLAEEDLPPDQWPEIVDAVVQDILKRMTEQDQKRIRETSKEALIQFHHGWGTDIRNHYGLWRGNKKLILSVCGKPCHPDDTSMVIIKAEW